MTFHKLNLGILLTLLLSMGAANAQDVSLDSDVDLYQKIEKDTHMIKACLERVPDAVTTSSLSKGAELKDRMIANVKERVVRARIQILIDRWKIQDCGELVSLISMSPSGSYFFPENSSRPAQYCLFQDRKNSVGNHVSPKEAVITCRPETGGTYFCRDRENEIDYARTFDRASINAVKSLRATEVHKKMRILQNWSSFQLGSL